MRIRWQRIPGTYRATRVELPWPSPPEPAQRPLPFKTRPVVVEPPPAAPPEPPRFQWKAHYRQKALAQRAAQRTQYEQAGQLLRATETQVARALELAAVSHRDLAAQLDVSRSSVTESKKGRRRHPVVSAWALGVLQQHGALDVAEEVGT